MTRFVFAILDLAAADIVGQFMLLPHEAVAVRSFGEVCSNPETLVHKHPKDFALVRFGQLDDLKLVGYDHVVVMTAEQWFAAQPGGAHLDLLRKEA